MDTFLDAKLREKDIECSIKNTNDARLTDDRTITLSEVRYEKAEEEMGRLLLGQLGRLAFPE